MCAFARVSRMSACSPGFRNRPVTFCVHTMSTARSQSISASSCRFMSDLALHACTSSLAGKICDVVAPHADAWDEAGDFPWDLHETAGALGLFGFGVGECFANPIGCTPKQFADAYVRRCRIGWLK